MIKLYNTLSRKKEIFKPIHKEKWVGLYTCGPTVYSPAHLGNFRTYIFEDILQRTLEYNGCNVKRVMNITDVGHLTSDADTGEDKVEKEAKKEKKSVKQITELYTKAFKSDARKLNIILPESLKAASKFIKEEQEIIKKLLSARFAYDASRAVYFNAARFKNYGKLSGQSLKEKITAARKEVIVDSEKKNPADFALWFKRTGRFKNHIQHWPSPWGDGFPGWHIECSAISRKFLGQPFDIHTGGVDHIGTHHTNEIAQSEAAYGKPLARYWLHGEFLLTDNSKMAKSEGNFFTVKDIESRGINPLAFRYLVLTSHYRSKLNFSWKSLAAAENALDNLYELIGETDKKESTAAADEKVAIYEKGFTSAINDDLNTPKALSLVWQVVKNNTLSSKSRKRLLFKFDRILGLELDRARPPKIPIKVRELASRREEYRRNKQFIQADRLRKEINELGYEIKDTPSGPVLRLNF